MPLPQVRDSGSDGLTMALLIADRRSWVVGYSGGEGESA